MSGVAWAPDPALAAVNLSRLLEQEVGTGEVFDSFNPCYDLLFILGASQHLTNVLLSQVLTQGYQFLRRLENRLRIERDQPVEA